MPGGEISVNGAPTEPYQAEAKGHLLALNPSEERVQFYRPRSTPGLRVSDCELPSTSQRRAGRYLQK